MLILVAGVVLLTYKKPEKEATPTSAVPLSGRGHRSATKGTFDHDEEEALHEDEGGEDATVWQLGDASEDEDDTAHPRSPRLQPGSPRIQRKASARSLINTSQTSLASLAHSLNLSPRLRPRDRDRSGSYPDSDGEETSMMADHAAEEEARARESTSSDATLARPEPAVFADEDDDAFGAWADVPSRKAL